MRSGYSSPCAAFRWQVRRPVARPNEFGRVADSFFFPVASGFRPEVAERLLGADFLLLGRLLTTLGTFVECSGNSMATRVLAKGVVELITPSATRFHPQVQHNMLAFTVSHPRPSAHISKS